MKWQVRIISRGRITVPLELQRALKARAGDKLEFQTKDGSTEVRIRVVKTKNGR
jgi:bifunctional DNA-binding transcriptional regulator/antitoxin component of YhaV-PrlF toxin-antitoxin module